MSTVFYCNFFCTEINFTSLRKKCGKLTLVWSKSLDSDMRRVKTLDQNRHWNQCGYEILPAVRSVTDKQPISVVEPDRNRRNRTYLFVLAEPEALRFRLRIGFRNLIWIRILHKRYFKKSKNQKWEAKLLINKLLLTIEKARYYSIFSFFEICLLLSVYGTGTKTFPQWGPEPQQIITVPQHCNSS